MTSRIRTRLLILSDTHGASFSASDQPLQRADVAIHCGDLTDGSKIEEFRSAVQLLKGINTPLKLVIAGNHDFTMDIPAFERKLAESTEALDPELVEKEYGAPGAVRELFDELNGEGIFFLDEGTHNFTLQNGAQLKTYASPYTPALGAWGFQYEPERGHDFAVDRDVDLVMTHGPPKGVLDYTHGRERAGCQDLFAAVAQARPLVHCFGHIHEGWGARLVTWQDTDPDLLNHFSAIENNRSHFIEKLAGLVPSRFDTEEDVEQRTKSMERYAAERCCVTSHASGDDQPIEPGKQTLFVNASIARGATVAQRPWVVDIDLPNTV